MAGSNFFRPTGALVSKNFRFRGSIPAPGFAEQTAPGPLTAGDPRASPTQTRKFSLKTVGEGLAPPAGRSGTGPYEKNASAPLFVVGAGPSPTCPRDSIPCRARPPGCAAPDHSVGAAHRAARERPDEDVGPYKNAAALISPRSTEPHLSPNTPKGALSARRNRTERLPNPQRQR